MLGSLVAQFSERDEVARTEIAKGFDAWIGGLADGLRRIQAAGEIGPRTDPEELATGLMAALQGGYTLAQATRAIAPMETALSMIDHVESFGATGDGTTASRSRAQSRRRRSFAIFLGAAGGIPMPTGTRSVIREAAVPRAHAPGRDRNRCSDPFYSGTGPMISRANFAARKYSSPPARG